MNKSEGSAGKISIDYFQMIQNNDQVKEKYKARIDKGKKIPDEFEGSSERDYLGIWGLIQM